MWPADQETLTFAAMVGPGRSPPRSAQRGVGFTAAALSPRPLARRRAADSGANPEPGTRHRATAQDAQAFLALARRAALPPGKRSPGSGAFRKLQPTDTSLTSPRTASHSGKCSSYCLGRGREARSLPGNVVTG